MRKLKIALIRTPILGRILLFIIRVKFSLGYFYKPLSNLVKWLFRSKEIGNFTYDLEQDNKRYLASIIADIVHIDFSVAMGYIKEIEENRELRQHISDATKKSDFAIIADKEVWFAGELAGMYFREL